MFARYSQDRAWDPDEMEYTLYTYKMRKFNTLKRCKNVHFCTNELFV